MLAGRSAHTCAFFLRESTAVNVDMTYGDIVIAQTLSYFSFDRTV